MNKAPMFLKKNSRSRYEIILNHIFQNIQLKWSVHKIAFLYTLGNLMEDLFTVFVY